MPKALSKGCKNSYRYATNLKRTGRRENAKIAPFPAFFAKTPATWVPFCRFRTHYLCVIPTEPSRPSGANLQNLWCFGAMFAQTSLWEKVTLSRSARVRITGARHFQSEGQSGLRVPVHHGKPGKTVARRPPARILQMQPGFGAPSPPKAKREAPERADHGCPTFSKREAL